MTSESLEQFDSVQRTPTKTEDFCRFRGEKADAKSNDIAAGHVVFGEFRYRTKVEICVSRFLYHSLKSWVLGNITSPVHSVDFFPRILALPSLSDQEKIARILDAAETVCELRKQSIALLPKLAESAFLDLFGPPSKENERWPLKQLDELASVKMPMSRYDINVKASPLPLVQGSDIRDIWLSDAKSGPSTPNDSTRHAEIVPEGCVLCPRIIGKTFNVSILDVKAIVFASCIVVRPSEDCLPEYLCMALRLCEERLWDSFGKPSLAQLTPSLLRSHALPVPRLESQRRYADWLRAIREQKKNIATLQQRSEELYKNLLDRLIGKPNRELHHAD